VAVPCSLRRVSAGRSLLLLAPLLGAMLLTGCGAGDVVDPVKTGIAVRYDVEQATGTKVREVDCPEGIAVWPGNRFACQVTAVNGDRALAELEVVNERADLRMVSLHKP